MEKITSKELTSELERANKIFNWTFKFWIASTLFFISQHGWHVKAACTPEEVCDFIATLGFILSAWIAIRAYGLAFHRVLSAIINYLDVKKAIKNKIHDNPEE